MGQIKEILGKVQFPEPKGWDMSNEQFNLPFTVELKENIHIHWQDIRIEMTASDFDKFAQSIAEARDKWIKDGSPQESEEMIRYGWWPGEEHLDFVKDRHVNTNASGEACHHYRNFPRTEMEKLYFDNLFQIELQQNGQLHLHYKNFRWELGKRKFLEMANSFHKAAKKLKKIEILDKIFKK